MKQKAEEALRSFKDQYIRSYADSNHSQVSEALALGVDQSTASNYMKSDGDRHLPAALVPLSAFASPLMDYLAEQCHGVFIPISGRLHADDREELRRIVGTVRDLITENDPKERAKLFKRIEKFAAKACLEDEVCR